jgi:hypothetical protein
MWYQYKKDKACSVVGGFYEENDGTIFLAHGLTEIQKELVYIHELEHRKCHQSGCRCWDLDDDCYLAEYHAWLGEFRAVKNRDNAKLTNAYFRSVRFAIRKMQKNPKIWAGNIKAVRRLLRLKEFKDFYKLKYRSVPKI